MSQFRTSGGLDDPIAEDGDRGFTGVNKRLQLNQLKAGEVRESLNGRMEGYWKPRKAVVVKSSGLTTGQVPLTIPFYLIDGSDTPSTISAATVPTAGTLRVTVTAHGFVAGDTIFGVIAGLAGNVTINGNYLLTYQGVNTLECQVAGLTSISDGVGTLQIQSKRITASSVPTNGTLNVTIASHGFEVDTNGYATIAGLTGNVAVNGVRLMTYVDTNTLSTPITGLTSMATDGIGTLSVTPINDNAISNVRGSCLFSDPSEDSKEYVIIALNSVVKKIDLETFQATDLVLPSGESIDGDVDMIQAFDKIYIFREGDQALKWSDGISTQFYKVAGGPYYQPVRFGVAANVAWNTGYATVTMEAGALKPFSGVATANGTQTLLIPEFFDNGIQRSYVDGYYNDTTVTINSISRTVSAYIGLTGQFTIDGAAITNGTQYSFTNLQCHTLKEGESLEVLNASSLDTIKAGDFLSVSDNTKYNQFRFQTVEAKTGTHRIDFGQISSLGGGFTFMPGPPWGVAFQRRLWVPFFYDCGGTLTAPTYTSRNIKDEILVSDILDGYTYDQIYNQFRISSGSADYLVAMHGFYEDSMIVLLRNSLHLIVGTQGTLADTVVKELTREVGCLARKSVVLQGNNLLFLSDNGIYGLAFIDQYNLRGVEQPLSRDVQLYIDRINKNLASNAVATYFNNRYWIALPLDSVAGANDAVGNNAILIYNFLNQGWESLDTYDDSRFLITNLIVARAGVRDDLYCVTSTGGLHRIDDVDGVFDVVSIDTTSSTNSSIPINSSLTTRGYDLGDLGRKRYTDSQLEIQALDNDASSELSIAFSTEDPDNATIVGTTTESIGEYITAGDTANVRNRLGGVRGYTGTVVLTRTAGSPKVHSIKVAGSLTNRSIISQH